MRRESDVRRGAGGANGQQASRPTMATCNREISGTEERRTQERGGALWTVGTELVQGKRAAPNRSHVAGQVTHCYPALTVIDFK